MRFETEAGLLQVPFKRVVVAGWTGRDAGAVQHHIEELAALGVPAPSTTPLYYRVSADLVTKGKNIEVLGDATSGEAEPFVVRAEGALWLGLGSDHTDRALEAHSVAASKQICGKPVAGLLWRLDAIADLDALELSSRIEEAGEMVLYQKGTLAAIRPLAELIEGAALSEGEAMFCGTLPAMGGVRPAPRFAMSLTDPHSGREISHEYRVEALPIIA